MAMSAVGANWVRSNSCKAVRSSSTGTGVNQLVVRKPVEELLVKLTRPWLSAGSWFGSQAGIEEGSHHRGAEEFLVVRERLGSLCHGRQDFRLG